MWEDSRRAHRPEPSFSKADTSGWSFLRTTSQALIIYLTQLFGFIWVPLSIDHLESPSSSRAVNQQHGGAGLAPANSSAAPRPGLRTEATPEVSHASPASSDFLLIARHPKKIGDRVPSTRPGGHRSAPSAFLWRSLHPLPEHPPFETSDVTLAMRNASRKSLGREMMGILTPDATKKN